MQKVYFRVYGEKTAKKMILEHPKGVEALPVKDIVDHFLQSPILFDLLRRSSPDFQSAAVQYIVEDSERTSERRKYGNRILLETARLAWTSRDADLLIGRLRKDWVVRQIKEAHLSVDELYD